jgi:hypothetical protein
MREAGKNSRPLASPRSSQSHNGTHVGCADSFGWIAMHIQISIAIHLSIDNRGALVEGVSISPGDSRACARGRENSANSAASSRYLIFRDPPSSLDTPNSYQLATSIGRETDRPSIRETHRATGAGPRVSWLGTSSMIKVGSVRSSDLQDFLGHRRNRDPAASGRARRLGREILGRKCDATSVRRPHRVIGVQLAIGHLYRFAG